MPVLSDKSCSASRCTARPIRTASRTAPGRLSQLPPGGQRGFALLIVLWVLVLIAFITAHVTASGRTEIRIAGNLSANAAAQAAADGGIYQAIFNLSDPRPERRWALDRAAHEVQIGRSRVTLQLEDEDARINPSYGSTALLEALLRVVGSDPGSAAGLANAIAEWVGSARQRPPVALLAEYQAIGLDYGPPGTPLESLDELARVRGMTPALLAALRPHLTLFGQPVPDRAAADAEVAAALDLAGRTAPASAVATAAAPDLFTVRIHATARGPANAAVTRTAIARVGPSLPHGYSLLAWDNAEE
jgi:general secretion pathway protein K